MDVGRNGEEFEITINLSSIVLLVRFQFDTYVDVLSVQPSGVFHEAGFIT